MPNPFFSLIIPTVGRTVELGQLFQSLDCSTCKDLECIVVDQNHDERLRQVLEPFGDRFPIRHLRVNFRGAARARNYGARHAIGKVLNFPDDDCELTPMLLEDVKRRLTTQPIKVLVGMCIDRSGDPSTTRFALDERPLTAWTMWGRNIEFTMFFDSSTFARAGGYDERFGVGSDFGSDEGAELLLRLLQELPPGRRTTLTRSAFTIRTRQPIAPPKAPRAPTAMHEEAAHYSQNGPPRLLSSTRPGCSWVLRRRRLFSGAAGEICISSVYKGLCPASVATAPDGTQASDQ